MKVPYKLSILLAASIMAITLATTASANTSDNGGGNVSDIGGGNVSDNGGGNVSDNGGGNVSDNGGGNVADAASIQQLAEDLGTAYASCQGGVGCSNFYKLYEQALNILD